VHKASVGNLNARALFEVEQEEYKRILLLYKPITPTFFPAGVCNDPDFLEFKRHFMHFSKRAV
jgi:hypothetical protein